MTKELGEVTATRHFYLADNPKATILIRLGRPQPTPNQNDFFCTLQVTGIGDEGVDAIYGVDEFQALQLAMHYAGETLVRLNKRNGLRLRWEGDEAGGFGF